VVGDESSQRGGARTVGRADTTRKYANGEARTAAILDAARHLFRVRGYPGTTVADIGSHAGISGPGIYRHFTGKRAILLELVEEAIAAHAAAADAARRLPDRDARIQHAAAGMVNTALAVRFTLGSFHDHVEGREGTDPEIAPQRQLIRIWADFVREENPGATIHEARAVVRMSGGLIQQGLFVVDRLGERRVKQLATPVVAHLLGTSLQDRLPRARRRKTTT
jgi:AcrR family transcriptional regulator